MSDGRGQALVEFALVLPFLLAFALAILLMAEIGVARVALEHAAAEGARIGSLTNDDDAPRSGDPRGSLLRVDLEYALPVPLAFAGLPRVSVRGAAARVIEWTP